jgi:hypothetical protein
VTYPVVHFDFVSLADNAADAAVGELLDAASELTRLEAVQAAGVVRGQAGSDFDLAFFFVLKGFADLEPFGTDPAYIRFLQGKVAPVLKGFAGADVSLRREFPEVGAFGSCLALAAPDETYDWEIWAALEGWGGDDAAVGLAIGERQRYRGCVIRFTNTDHAPLPAPEGAFQASFVAGAAQRL